MLPAPISSRFSLADVFPSALASVQGSAPTIPLPPVTKAVVVLVDGLGLAALKARAGHARMLIAAVTARGLISAGFPTTTASALTTLTTGTHPGEHGMVGYSVLDAANDRVVNQLSGWDALIDPATWQRRDTVFQTAAAQAIRALAIGPERYRDSDFSRAVLRGAEYLAGASMSDRFDVARAALSAPDRTIAYVYVPELDVAGHAEGWESTAWTSRLEEFDGAFAAFLRGLPRDVGVLVTADHGVVDIPERSHVLFGADRALVDGIRHVAGEPRALQLHWEPDASATTRASLVTRWRDSEADRAWVATRDEAVAAGWFGPAVDPEVLPRIGDLLVVARKNVVYYDERTATARSRQMVGQHGALSAAETAVPLLRFGAYAR